MGKSWCRSVGVEVCDDFAVGLLGCVSHCVGAMKSGGMAESGSCSVWELRCGGLVVWEMQYAGVQVVAESQCGKAGSVGVHDMDGL